MTLVCLKRLTLACTLAILTAAVPAVSQNQRSQTARPASPLPRELQVRVNSAIVRYVESSTHFGVPLFGGGLEGRIRGVVGESNVGSLDLTLSAEGWACTDDNELVIADYTLEIRPGDYLECSGSAAPDLTVRFVYGAFTLRGDWVEIETGTLAYVFQHPGQGIPYVFSNGLWTAVERNEEFQLVSADVSEYGGFLILINKEKYTLRNIKLEIISDTGHYYWFRIPELAPNMVVSLDLEEFKDGAGAKFDSKMAQLRLFCEVNGVMGRAGWNW